MFLNEPNAFSVHSSNIVLDLPIQENHNSFVDTFKLLGTSIDRKLGLDQNASNFNKRSKIFSRNLFSSKFKETLLKSLEETHFDYFSILFNFIKQSFLTKLRNVKNKSLKIILGVSQL